LIYGDLLFELVVSQKKPKKKRTKRSGKEKEKNSNAIKKLKIKDLEEFLNNQYFYLQIYLMNHIIKILNKYNINLQSQKASISHIKRNIHQCYYSILELVLKPLMSDNNIDY